MHWFGFAAIGSVLVAVGFLAYALIDPEAAPLGDPCDEEPCTAPFWRDPGALRGLLIIFGFFGTGLVAWGFAMREHEDAP